MTNVGDWGIITGMERVEQTHARFIRPRRMRARRYTPQGFRAQNVKFALRRLPFNLAAIFCALCVPLLVMLDVRESEAVAEWWTTHVQAGWEKVIGTLTDWLPFSVLELFIVSGLIVGAFLLVRLFINLCTAKFKRILIGVLSLCVGGAYVLNLYALSMGFGYYRAPMPVPQAGKDYSQTQARAAVEYFLADYNHLADTFDRDENGCVICPYTISELADILVKEYSRLDDPYFTAYTPRIKPVVNSWFLSDTLTTGVTFLPFGEATVNTDAPPSTVTITAAHELAHAKGVQREGDADLLARYILLSSDDGYLRYCGYYASFDNLLETMLLFGDNAAYNELGVGISKRVSTERRYAIKYWNSQPDIVGRIFQFFNNAYLQFNGASNGTGSYDDGNQSDVIIPINPDTGEPEKDPDTGEILREVYYSQVQMMYFWIYENRSL